jgi:Flp pilus assembly protein TadG
MHATRTTGGNRMNANPEDLTTRRLRTGGQRARRGNIAIIAAIAVFPIIAAVGLGVDYTRLSLVKMEMQRGTDAAALAGARILNADGSNREDVTGDALMYFWANYRRSVADARVVGDNPAVTIVEPGRDTVKIVADVRVPLAFGNFLGIGDRTLQVSASAQRTLGGMEVALVLDNTGSMARGTRMADLKSAAKDLVEILYGASDTKQLQVCPPGNPLNGCTSDYTLTVGIVPFITVVNVSTGQGDGNAGRIVDRTEVEKHAWGRNAWKGCVMARPYPFEESRADATPAESPFMPYFWQSTASWGVNPWTADTSEAWPAAAAPDGKAAVNVASVGAGAGRETGPNLGCGQPLMPLQPSKAAALAQIDGLQIGAGTGTAVPIGLAWGWRLLSPDWRPYWSGRSAKIFADRKEIDVTTPAAVPRDYDTRNFEKVIVLFSDGENDLGVSRSADGCCMTAYGDPPTMRATLGASERDAEAEVNRRTAEICSAIKAKGIKLYVVLLYPDPPQALLDLYNEKGCASGRNSFFHASSESQLRGIFSTVGSQLKNLRLVQ